MIFDLYGTHSSNLTEAKDVLEQVLGFSFLEADSAYQGGEYFHFGDKNAEHFVLKRNVDPFDGEPAEQDFPAYPVLLYVNDTRRSLELQDGLQKLGAAFELLRHEDI